jgi:hypothetical protein
LLVTKGYIDTAINNSQPNLSNFLTINDVYVPPNDLIVVEVPNPNDNKLTTKKYVDSAIPDSYLTINDTAAIADTGHYITGYDVYNHNSEINPVYYPLSTSGVTDDKFKLATLGFVYDLVPDLTNYLTADMVYVPLATTTSGFDVSGITAHNPDDDKLVTKKYVDDLFSFLSNS